MSEMDSDRRRQDPDRQLAELATLADGTLTGEARERALKRADERLLEEQRRAVQTIRAAADEVHAPRSLQARIGAMTPPPRRRRLPALPVLIPARNVAAGLAVAVAALAVGLSLAFTGGTGAGPTVAQAATLTQRAPTLSAPHQRARHSVVLERTQSGLPFPYWEDRFGWRAAGARVDHLQGRQVTTVFYRRGDGTRIGYAIVAGPPLREAASARRVRRGGVWMSVLHRDARTIVTWLREGHTCVLAGGSHMPASTLERLASWRAHGRIPY